MTGNIAAELMQRLMLMVMLMIMIICSEWEYSCPVGKRGQVVPNAGAMLSGPWTLQCIAELEMQLGACEVTIS